MLQSVIKIGNNLIMLNFSSQFYAQNSAIILVVGVVVLLLGSALRSMA